MQTERFKKLRRAELSKIFEKKFIVDVWRKIVRDQLRSMDLKDLYDHYDFNYNIEERATNIRNDILNGKYKVSQSLTYRVEKKFGVCRHLIVPQPTDALVFQVLVESLIFTIIEEISWKPDYLPYSSRGLPTTNIEGVRLLAHTFLFEIDEVLKQKTNNSFTRWMDDITVGVNSRKQAIEIISAISDMLKSRGLSLNLSKTDIYDEKQGYYNFQIEENRYLDSIEKITKADSNYKEVCKNLHKRFKERFKDQGARYWDKVTKRYITAFGRLGSTKLLTELPRIYVEFPSLRENLNIYLSSLGYKKNTADKILKILKSIDIFDDISLYQLCFLITQWEVPVNDKAKQFLKEFEDYATKFSFERKLPSDF